MRFMRWTLMSWCVAICMVGCVNGDGTDGILDQIEDPLPYRNSLTEAALATHAAWIRAINDGDALPTEDIPERYWADEIAELEPVRVYSHRANLVVAQRVVDGVEEGKYINILISSYLPLQGFDGFTYSPNPQTNGEYHVHETLDYTRTLKE